MIEHIRQSSLLTRVFATNLQSRAIIVQRNEEVICNVTRFSRVKSMATNVPSSIPTLDGDGNAGFERERKEEKRRHMLTLQIVHSSRSSYSDSSIAASTRSSTKPRATPTRTNPLMMGTTVKISDATSHFVAMAPPLALAPPTRPAKHCARIMATNACSVLCDTPKPITLSLLSGFNPPNVLSPLTLMLVPAASARESPQQLLFLLRSAAMAVDNIIWDKDAQVTAILAISTSEPPVAVNTKQSDRKTKHAREETQQKCACVRQRNKGEDNAATQGTWKTLQKCLGSRLFLVISSLGALTLSWASSKVCKDLVVEDGISHKRLNFI